jgi:hypothetical protein
MFDAATSELIRAAPRIADVDPALLPQRLTDDYVELTALRLRAADEIGAARARKKLSDLRELATIYEAIVDRGTHGEQRRAAAFVAATAYQIQSRFLPLPPERRRFLTANSIDPAVAAPLLFLIAEQSPDAKEAAGSLSGVDGGDRVRSALVEALRALATEQFDSILRRATNLVELRSDADRALEDQSTQALYGLCWRGLVQMAAQLLAREVPFSRFVTFESPRVTFQHVVDLATNELNNLTLQGGRLFSSFAGPRHLARLLSLIFDALEAAGVANLPPPDGTDPAFWRGWLAHRARTKPVLWRNHRTALATNFHWSGQSAVIVLPTGAGKTTLSEIKIASTLSTGRSVVFLVPTLALVEQLREDLAGSFPQELTAVTPSVNADLTALAAGLRLERLEVMTPERCLAILSFAPEAFANVGLIIFDECHMLTPKGSGKRSIDAMVCLLQAIQRAPNADLLLLSAMITNHDELAAWIAMLTGRPCRSISDLWKPSRQARGVVIYNEEEVSEARNSAGAWRRAKIAAKAARRKAPRKPRTCATPFALFGLQHNWHPEAPQDTSVVKLLSEPVDLTIASTGAHLTPNANSVAAALAVGATTGGLKTIVFVQNAGHAAPTARKLSAHVPQPSALTESELRLWDEIQAEMGGAEHSLVNPQDGALPHNGDMLVFERQFAERRFRRADGGSALVASPTLAQGMNLPAQLAILAGDKRHDESGRSSLEAHEILNAAGRAGRAGYLANGVVLLVPEPIVVFDQDGARPNAIEKLRQLLPPSDACLAIVDPLTELLDRIQDGDTASSDTRYLLSRLSAGQEDGAAPAAAAALVGRSFYAYKLRLANEEARRDAAIAAVQAAMQQRDAEGEAWIAQIAALTGQLLQPLAAASNRLSANVAAMPQEIISWSDWLVDWWCDDIESRTALVGDDSLLLQITRGKKTGGPLTVDEFHKLKVAMRAWLRGEPLRDIEAALGVPADKLGTCPRARDLALKLVTRSVYIALTSVAAIAKRVLADAGVAAANPAVLDVLPFAVRFGVDLPDKAAYLQMNPSLRSRVLLHREFMARLGNLDPLVADSYRDLYRQLEILLEFLG